MAPPINVFDIFLTLTFVVNADKERKWKNKQTYYTTRKKYTQATIPTLN